MACVANTASNFHLSYATRRCISQFMVLIHVHCSNADTELINVGQKQEALEALHSFITSRRYRAWTRTHEKIMLKYVELCVDMRRGRHAKDGLIQYRVICQQVNITSLEEVIKHFMQMATEKAELARNQAQALEEALDVDDLEADKRPEDLLLSYVSGEKGKDRSDRVTPWFKFLWETYRTVLEILRNNSRLESLYAVSFSPIYIHSDSVSPASGT